VAAPGFGSNEAYPAALPISRTWQGLGSPRRPSSNSGLKLYAQPLPRKTARIFWRCQVLTSPRTARGQRFTLSPTPNLDRGPPQVGLPPEATGKALTSLEKTLYEGGTKNAQNGWAQRAAALATSPTRKIADRAPGKPWGWFEESG